PPYMAAMDYIRFSKQSLYWLGYKESEVKELFNKQIPFQKFSWNHIQSDTYEEYREKIDKDLLRLYENYFSSILKSFTSLSKKISSHLCILVGLSKIGNIRIPIEEIITEHLSN
ncbi:unnamed protein product, partial [marine sediment metagenome]